MPEFEIRPRGPFNLAAAQKFAGGFTAGIGGGVVGERSIVMSFPIEGWEASAAVEMTQTADGRLVGMTDAPAAQLAQVEAHAARSLSLDHDGAGWPMVGERDPVIGRLQQQYGHLRPVCFYSAYEAASSFVVGQRISMRQNARIKERLRESHGDQPTVDGKPYPAFPRPQRLLEIDEVPGVSAQKVSWLHGLARAALDGRLDTSTLRNMAYADALESLRAIPGVGPWTSEGVLLRGCGIADALPRDERGTLRAVAELYGRDQVTQTELESIAEAWRPYRMWAVVLLRVGWSRSGRRVSYRLT